MFIENNISGRYDKPYLMFRNDMDPLMSKLMMKARQITKRLAITKGFTALNYVYGFGATDNLPRSIIISKFMLYAASQPRGHHL
jgi:hypothetical protein